MDTKAATVLLCALILMAVQVPHVGLAAEEKTRAADNPFLKPYNTPFDTPPFDRIRNEHYMPAFEEGMRRQLAEIDALLADPAQPDFKNTFDRLDKTGLLLYEVSATFFSLYSAETNEEMQAIAQEIAPKLSAHRDSIAQNEKLFRRLDAVYQAREKLSLTPEQRFLLESLYKEFVRAGAKLDEKQKARLREINQELSVLRVKFGNNVLAETNGFRLTIDTATELTGLPPTVVAGALDDAKQAELDGKWVFTTHKPSMIPFLQYSENRPLREKLYTAYFMRCNHDDDKDNKEILRKIINLRIESSKLLGYPNYAAYALETNMAKNPEAVNRFLKQLWDGALPMARREAAELQALARKEGGDFAIEPWDWWFYAEKLKKARYEFDDSVLRPYFMLNNVRDGIFTLCEKLYGIKFIPRTDMPKYHPDVQVFEVQEADGRHIGILCMDFFPRPGKRAGAWSGGFRDQYRIDGKNITPIATLVGNFSKPTSDEPSLLTLDDVDTFFHEFGHALNSLFSNCDYRYRAESLDSVELPSQIMENWALEPEMLKLYAKHYKTGETIPQDLVEKLKKSKQFNQGFETVEYLAACILDMDLHTVTVPVQADLNAFESESMKRIGLIREILPRYRCPYFQHIIGGYAAGYYSYVWAEVLDADAFEAFKEKGLFDRATAQAFRTNVLAKSGTDDAAALYRKFRGADPKIEPLLKRRGLLPATATADPQAK
ncbi:MAG: M3 family metallopeptidase [Acidobacteriota bacterium]